ncbi:MAG: hypothetical protein IJM34_09150 [Lachnospiraceae bacterium]|nr:hypothetical protein [Lachnospiraceae bacterium]
MGAGQNLTGYHSKAQQANDAKGSAYALTIVGAAAMILALLWAFNLLPGNMSISRRFLMCGSLGIISLVLLIAGYYSMKSSKRLRKGAIAEDKRTEEIMKWAAENLSCEKLDEGMIAENSVLEEEEKCILRMQRISYELDLKFMNLDPAYIDEMSERIYQMLYENGENAKGEAAS